MLLGGCATIRYYGHVAHGETALLLARRPIPAVLDDPRTPPALVRRLALAGQARRFASLHLDLPDNRSYTSYVALDRPYVAWNVFAAPRYSVEAVPQCFPIAGCVAYRGYFRESLAHERAAALHRQGLDVWVAPVPAYSTLGWFADPILSSMMRWDDDELAGTLFHELAHQQVYVKGDTAFNESFATFVEREGLREWRASRGLPPSDGRDQAMDDAFTARVLALRDRLRQDYARPGDAEAMERRKQADIAAFRADYAAWRDRAFPGDHRYDAWVAAPINNARLLPFGLYDRWTGAFATLFAQSDRQWPAFYKAAAALGRKVPAQRLARLRQLAGEGGGMPARSAVSP
ncbi:MAG TPA: aminopeptidase [Dyella sp.]|nr:aminopeptidase [Dyella sp.]